jgi:hypothetical protein
VYGFQKNLTKLTIHPKCRGSSLAADSVTHLVEELIQLIQNDDELWEIVEQLKHPDEGLDDFILSVAQMLSVEFEILHRGDLDDKLAALFGGLPEPAFKMAPIFLHIALDLFLMRAIPNKAALEG